MDESAGLIARTDDPAVPQTIRRVAGPPGFLGRIRIGRRIGLLAILAVLSLAGGGAAHIFGDMRLEAAAAKADQNTRIVNLVENIDKDVRRYAGARRTISSVWTILTSEITITRRRTYSAISMKLSLC